MKKVKAGGQEVENCLILGLGGGSAARLIKKYWPDAEIIGVDIDPVIVELGKKYLGLDDLGVEIRIEDTKKFLKRKEMAKKQFDLILVDMYVGYEVPKEFESEEFIQSVKKKLTNSGSAIFNRLYFDEKRKLAEQFHRKLIHEFRKVRPIYPEANVMYVCSS